MPASKRLRDLVRDIRATRTAAEERAIVNRECALIRDSFREENNVFRYRNVAKLLYIHMLGYPAHFGQLECLKLIASPRFTDKRVGYLGAMLLLDERTDVHLLVTNSLKNDLNHPTAYVVSLALCTLGSICSTEMSRDLAGEVERLIKSHNPYLKKKAILCAYQIIRKVPELMEMFIPCTRGLLNDKNHGVLLASCCLIQEMCERSPDTLAYFRKQLVPTIIRTLKHVIATGYSPDHDVNRVTDPFLQVKLLRLMRVLGHGDPTVSESMNDILAQVATNTDTSRNVGNAILYEIVLTIMGIESDPGLRVLAINILGRFLLSNFRDIRYVALNTLLRVVHADSQPIQRHRLTIVDCLSDLDVSIKRRAVDLCFALINRSNVRSMVKELILYLQHCDAEFKGDLCSNLVTVTEKYAPNKQWHIDSLLSMLMTAGNYARDDVVSSLISLIAQNEELHACATKHLYSALRTTLTQQPLVQVASWVIGEYGDLLLSADQNDLGVTENEVIDLLHSALVHPSASLASKQMVLTALTKLTTRFSTDCHPRLKEIIQSYTSNVQLDLQQRSVEYEKICSQSNDIRNGLLDYMPAPTPRGLANGFEHSSPEKSEDNPTNVVEFANEPILNGMKAAPDSALTILDLLGEPEKNGTDSHDHQTSSTAAANQPGASNDLLELLDIFAPTSAQPVNHTSDDLLSGLAPIPQPTSTTSNSHPTNPGQATSTGGLDLANELSQLGLTSSSQPNSAPPLNVYDANGLKVVFHFDQPQPVPNEKRRQLTIRLVATATSSHPIEGFEFQAAVPKSCQLQILPASSTTIQPGMLSSPLSQQLKIWYNPKTPIRMRVRLQYTHDGQPRLEQFQLDTFPPVLWQ